MTVNMLLPQSDRATSSRTVAEWLWPFVPMGAAAFSLSALVYYHLRQNVFEVRSPLQQLYAWLYRTVGFAPAVLLCGLVIVWSTIWLATGRLERAGSRVLRLVAMTVMLGIFLNLGDGAVAPAAHKGALGAWFADTLVGTFGYWPSLVVVWAVTFASLLLATDFFFHESFERLRTTAPANERETGVEPAVTEHLRGLSALVPANATSAHAAPSHPVGLAPEALDQAFAAAAALDVDDVPGAPPAEPESAPRRRSYAERRAERAARWRQPAGNDEIFAPEPAAPPVAAPYEVAATPRDEQPAAAELASGWQEAGIERAPAPRYDTRDDAAEESAAEGFADEEFAAEGGALVHVLDEGIPSPRDDEAARDMVTLPRAPLTGASDGDEEPRPDDGDLSFAGAEPSFAGRRDDAVPAAEREAATDEAAEPEREALAATDDEAEAEAEAEAEEAGFEPEPARARTDEPVVAIPRPPAAIEELEPRQQQLFGGSQLDEGLVQEAIDVVTGAGRASVALLQRKLRVDYALAAEVLTELAARGVVALDGDATTGRVLR